MLQDIFFIILGHERTTGLLLVWLNPERNGLSVETKHGLLGPKLLNIEEENGVNNVGKVWFTSIFRLFRDEIDIDPRIVGYGRVGMKEYSRN